METIKILDVKINPISMNDAVGWLNSQLIDRRQTLVITANAEIIMMAQNDPAYFDLVNGAELVLPDGAGTVWAGRHLGYPVPERVAGYDLFHRLLALAAQEEKAVYFFGGKPGVAETAAQKAKELYPGLKIAGCHHGYFKEEDNCDMINEINQSGAEMLFAALGAPKQEYWLHDHREQLQPVILMGIGGSFDVISGNVKRAPLWMQKAGLEWLYRLIKEPFRFKRMASTLPLFVIKVLRSKK